MIHHLRHWAHGGGTCLANLVSLCEGHHWLVHEGGYALAVRRPGEWVLISPDGVRVGPHPQPHEPTQALPVDPTVASDAVTGQWDGSRLRTADLVSALIDTDLPAPTDDKGVPAGTLFSAQPCEFRCDAGDDEDEVDYSMIRVNCFVT